jgi:hypothetical protein
LTRPIDISPVAHLGGCVVNFPAAILDRIVRRPMVALSIVVLVALVVRLMMLYTARFSGDEALFFGIAMDIAEGKEFPLLGTQITDGQGRLPGPAFLYVMALPLLVWRAPEAQYAFVEILGAVTVGVLWHALRRPFSERAAFATALLVACSPWSALYADRTWNPNVLPFLVAIALLAAVRLRERPASPWMAVFLPVSALMAQFHMSAPVAWAGLIAIAWPARKGFSRKALGLGLALVLLLYLPLIAHELNTGFGNTKNILAETVGQRGGERHPWGFAWVPVYALRFLTLDVTYHELTSYWGGPDEWKCLRAAFQGTPPRPFHLVRLTLLLSSIALAVWAIASSLRAVWSRRSLGPWGAAFLAVLAVNMLLMGAAAKQVFGHYVTNLYPFVVVAWAALAVRLEGTRAAETPDAVPQGRVGRALFAVLVGLFCIGGVNATWEVSQRVDAKAGLGVHRRAMAVITEDARAQGIDPHEPVRLDFHIRSSHYDWHIFANRALGQPITFDDRAPRRRYILTDLGKDPPRGAATPAVPVGHALLWRLP